MGLIGDFLELIGLGGITGVDILFAAMAIVGTFLFIIYFLLILIGDFTGGFFDFEMDADGIFHLFTIQGLLSFIMMFGIFGLSVSQADQNAFVAIIAGTIAGTFSMYIVGKVFQIVAKAQPLQSVSTTLTLIGNETGGSATVTITVNKEEVSTNVLESPAYR